MEATITPTVTLRAQIERGCTLLDAKWERQIKGAWEPRIDCETLDIADGGRCVFAQLYGSWVVGKIRLNLHCSDLDTMLSYYGFTSLYPEDMPPLTSLWKEIITERLQQQKECIPSDA